MGVHSSPSVRRRLKHAAASNRLAALSQQRCYAVRNNERPTMQYKKSLRVLGIGFVAFGALQLLAAIFFDMSSSAFNIPTMLWPLLGLVCVMVDGALNEVLAEVAPIKARSEHE